jgi:arsenate reductase
VPPGTRVTLLLRALSAERYEAFSAGTEATAVRPLAIRAMAELGIDVSGQESKTLDRYLDQPFDLVITVCDEANEACPIFLGAKQRLHWSLPDPSKASGTEQEQLQVYRAVRDALHERIETRLHLIRDAIDHGWSGRTSAAVGASRPAGCSICGPPAKAARWSSNAATMAPGWTWTVSISAQRPAAWWVRVRSWTRRSSST